MTAVDPLIGAVERLTREVLALRADMARLLDRIEEYEDENVRLAPIIKDELRPPKTVEEAIRHVDHTRRVINAIEIDVQAMRSKIDDIARNPEARKEFAAEAIKDASRSKAEREFAAVTRRAGT